ncbi:MAG TPA: hypothetical protein VFC53_11960 [Dehalococcoidia bacterium]|nr:hypothetical protein [Dehalococcoidia bacterium]
MPQSACYHCDARLDGEDNFCRRCGAPAGDAPLPAVRPSLMPATWQPRVPPVVKGAAVMAAGTIGQFVLRRVVHGLITGGDGARRPRALRRREPDGLTDEAQIITETVMVRRVRIRRQA